MEVYTIGFTKKTAQQFFQTLKQNNLKQLLDVRLNNSSQLAAFAKQADLAYFLQEICGARYLHDLRLAPTQEMLDNYKKKKGDWRLYEEQFLDLMRSRQIEKHLEQTLFSVPTVLLCSEPTAEHCHRRLVLDYLQDFWQNLKIIHL
jgi:uncharacterized protein (DUF488 family)